MLVPLISSGVISTLYNSFILLDLETLPNLFSFENILQDINECIILYIRFTSKRLFNFHT